MSTEYQKNNLITDEVIEYFKSVIPKSHCNQNLNIDRQHGLISMTAAGKKYLLKANENGDKTMYVQVGNSILLYNPKVESISQRKIRTKKSKISANKKVVLFSVFALLMAFSTDFALKHLENNSAIETLSESDESRDIGIDESLALNESIPHVTLNVDLSDVEEVQENVIKNVVELEVPVKSTDALGFEKRERTVSLYGDRILHFTKRYGMPYEFMVDLLSQERHNDYDDVSVEEKNNIGQLTPVLCTEPIVTPVFKDDNVIGYEGFFILPGTYPSTAPAFSLESIDTQYLNEVQQSNLKRAISLEKNMEISWNVYRKNDVFYKADENIQISIAYLSYLVNMKNDFIKGVMSYHAGYVKVKDDFTRESIVSGEIMASDANYIKNILQYEPVENYNNGFQFKVYYESKEPEIYQITNPLLELEVDYEEKNGYHL